MALGAEGVFGGFAGLEVGAEHATDDVVFGAEDEEDGDFVGGEFFEAVNGAAFELGEFGYKDGYDWGFGEL